MWFSTNCWISIVLRVFYLETGGKYGRLRRNYSGSEACFPRYELLYILLCLIFVQSRTSSNPWPNKNMHESNKTCMNIFQSVTQLLHWNVKFIKKKFTPCWELLMSMIIRNRGELRNWKTIWEKGAQPFLGNVGLFIYFRYENIVQITRTQYGKHSPCPITRSSIDIGPSLVGKRWKVCIVFRSWNLPIYSDPALSFDIIVMTGLHCSSKIGFVETDPDHWNESVGQCSTYQPFSVYYYINYAFR